MKIQTKPYKNEQQNHTQNPKQTKTQTKIKTNKQKTTKKGKADALHGNLIQIEST